MHRPALAFLVLAACVPATAPPPPLIATVQQGPAAHARPQRVLVLHASCGSVEHRCPRSYIEAVDAIVRNGLEVAGYALVDPDTLRLETRQRHEEHETKTTTSAGHSETTIERKLAFDDHVISDHDGTTTSTRDLVVLDGPGFEDLTVLERREVLDQAGADAVLNVRIVIGGQIGLWTPNHSVEVLVRLGADRGDTMAWAATCGARSREYSTVDAALEHAARCAIAGATSR